MTSSSSYLLLCERQKNNDWEVDICTVSKDLAAPLIRAIAKTELKSMRFQVTLFTSRPETTGSDVTIPSLDEEWQRELLESQGDRKGWKPKYFCYIDFKQGGNPTSTPSSRRSLRGLRELEAHMTTSFEKDVSFCYVTSAQALERTEAGQHPFGSKGSVVNPSQSDSLLSGENPSMPLPQRPDIDKPPSTQPGGHQTATTCSNDILFVTVPHGNTTSMLGSDGPNEGWDQYWSESISALLKEAVYGDMAPPPLASVIPTTGVGAEVGWGMSGYIRSAVPDMATGTNFRQSKADPTGSQGVLADEFGPSSCNTGRLP